MSSTQRLEVAAAQGATGTLAFAGDPNAGPIICQARLTALQDQSLLFAVSVEDIAQIHGRVALGSTFTGNLRQTNEDLLFCARLERFEVSESGAITVVTTIPGQVAATRRRRSFRFPVTAEDAIVARIWRLERHALVRDRPLPSTELPCELLELGGGGMRALVRARGKERLNFVENFRFRVELSSGKESLLFEACLRHPKLTQPDDVEVHCGFRFVDRDDIETRRAFQKLQNLLAVLQRSAARRRAA